MKLIAVTAEEDFRDEHRFLGMLIAEGFIIHCRKPGKTNLELAAYLRKIPAEFRDAIAIHQHHELAEDMGIRRLHFPEKLRKETDFTEEKYFSFTLSTSIHQPEDLGREKLQYFDYVFCGPVYDSISKNDYPGKDFWKRTTAYEEVSKIAIGGVTPDKLLEVSEWGYDGLAFSGYLWNRPGDLQNKIDTIKEVWLKDLTH